MSRFVEFAAVIAAVVAIQLVTWIAQPPIAVNEGRGFDGKDYHSIATQLSRGEPPRAMSRFAKRLGTPFLASLVDDGDLIAAFKAVNVAATFVSAILLLIWLRRYLHTPWLRVLLVVVYASHWLQLVRFTFYYPVLVDAWAQLFCFAGLNCIAWYQSRPGRWPLAAVAAISAVGVLFRELVLLVPVAFLFVTNPGLRHSLKAPYVAVENAPRPGQWIPLGLAGVALVGAGRLIVATDPAFSMSDHFGARALSRSLVSYTVGWLLAFGPALFIILFDWRSAAAFLRRHTAFAVYTAGAAAIGWAASLEASRHALFWTTPVVFVLAGRTIERHRDWFRSPVFAGVLVAAQAFTGRVFMATPQAADGDIAALAPRIVLTPVGEQATYLHLFPTYVAPHLVWIQFAQYMALGCVILVWMSRRAYVASIRSGSTPPAGIGHRPAADDSPRSESTAV